MLSRLIIKVLFVVCFLDKKNEEKSKSSKHLFNIEIYRIKGIITAQTFRYFHAKNIRDSKLNFSLMMLVAEIAELSIKN